MIKVFEVNTVERVKRRYLVEVKHSEVESGNDEAAQYAYWRRKAIEKVSTGEVHKFTEGNAEIEEITSAKEQ